ncbi:TIGR01244 family sulfur transferase [Marinobacter caseinilyticus]|uniref:TIGR01244 family sulfur transferase n=1 Tax=Marinobacter caseinilyticus TaxID=2692195 RepID=UPI001409CFB7|nr:TIGR01244 family sulfur transferase [Marinobacter caseinilyticus]
MNIKKLDDNLSVSAQITVDDVGTAASLGFKTLVANRPDREEMGQPAMADIEAAAKEHGLSWVYLPVQSGNILDSDVDDFVPMLENADKPILAFCRSGLRCTVLWALSNARFIPADPLINRAREAGYDLAPLRPRLAEQAAKAK